MGRASTSKNESNVVRITFIFKIILKSCIDSGYRFLEFIYLFKDVFIYFREREGGGPEGQGERESQTDSLLSVEPYIGLDPMT